MPVLRRPYVLLAALFAVLSLLVTGCSTEAVQSSPTPLTPHGAAGPESKSEVIGSAPPAPEVPAPPREIPALGPQVRAQLPATSRQAFVVVGEASDSNRSTAMLYTRDDPAEGWRPATGPWTAHNGLRGWTDHHVAGDLKSPNGVFGLTDAGGRLADPGALLPYDEQPRFAVSGDGFFGESLEGSFDYVVAINYNREPGTSPLDRTRPFGEGRGGGIWIHVDHGGPTQGCVSLPEDRMKELLRTLDPAMNPVIVMGDVTALGR